jgi:hypothetical protein
MILVINEIAPVAGDVGVEMADVPEQSALRFGVASAGGTAGSNPRHCSISSRGTNDQPMASAYSWIRAWTVLCSLGVDTMTKAARESIYFHGL